MQKSSYEEKLGTDAMFPLVFKMALPAVAAQIVNLLYNIVDRMYIGHIPEIGAQALAGIGVTGSVIILISAFSQIVAGGGAPLAAIALGQNDREKAEKILANGFTLLLLFAFGCMAITFAFMKPLLVLIGASSATIGYAHDYLSVYLFGTVCVMIAVGLNTFINCQGRPKIAMFSVLIGAILNIVLDPVFIYTFDMGVRGAALATVLSQLCSAIFVLRFLFSDEATLRIQTNFMKLEKETVLSIVRLGIAPFIMAATESLVGFVLNGSLSRYGDIYVSALTVMQSAMQFASVPLTGFAQGFVPIVSYNYGHGNAKRLKECFKITLFVMFTYNLLVILFMILQPAFVARLFTDEVELIEKVSSIMPVFMAGMLIFGLQRECQQMFVALGQAKISLFIALLRKVFLLIPLALLLPNFMGVMGVYTAEAVADATAAILCTCIFAFTFPKILKETEAHSA